MNAFGRLAMIDDFELFARSERAQQPWNAGERIARDDQLDALSGRDAEYAVVEGLVVQMSEQRRGMRGRTLHRLPPLPQNGRWMPLWSASAATASTQKNIAIHVCS